MTTPTRVVDPLRQKALAVLREGRCRIVHVSCQPDSYDIDRVEAHVTSSRNVSTTYVVDYVKASQIVSRWLCTCRAGMRSERCPHVAAVQMVTES